MSCRVRMVVHPEQVYCPPTTSRIYSHLPVLILQIRFQAKSFFMQSLVTNSLTNR